MNPLGQITAGRRLARAKVARKASRRFPRLEALEDRRLMAGGVVQLVQFSGAGLQPLTPDAGGAAIMNPRYSVVGSKMDPVCFIQNTVATVTAQIKLSAPDNDVNPKIEVQETAADGLNVKPTAATLEANKQTVDLPATALAGAFPKDNISAYSPLTMTWQVSLDGGTTWQAAGTSTNPVYVILAKPINDGHTPVNFVTVAKLSCTYGAGATSNDTAVPKIFGAFTGLNVKRADGTPLKYYGDYLTRNTTTAKLLSTGVGQCGSFTGLFLDMLKIQGIGQAKYEIISPKNGANGFLVKSWTFGAAKSSGNPLYPYLNYTMLGVPFRKTNGYQFAFADVTRSPMAADQIKGQNNADPAADFNNHQVAMYTDAGGTTTYYDPSYGKTFTSLDDFNTKAIAGFFQHLPAYRVKIAGVPVLVNAYLIKKNSGAAGQLQQTLFNYY
jgi:hypothetical protein